MTYVGKYKYEPSSELLNNLFKDLVSRRTSLAQLLQAVWKEQQANSQGFGFGNLQDWELEQSQQALRQREDILKAERRLVEALLRPFDEDAARFREEQDKKACDAIMAL